MKARSSVKLRKENSVKLKRVKYYMEILPLPTLSLDICLMPL